jgi:hypothetical protein
MIALSKDSSLRSVWRSLFRGSGDDDDDARCIPIRTVLVVAVVFLGTGGGILVSGYLCFAIGSILAFEATRATVRVVGGYRSEWMRFLNHEVHRWYRRCQKATTPTTSTSITIVTTVSSKSLRHPRTGSSIHGYHVEYAYRVTYNDNATENGEGILRKRTKDVRRVILVDKSSHGTARTKTNNDSAAVRIDTGIDTGTSVSYYRKELVRSLAEYMQHEQHETEQRKRQLELYREDSDDSSSDSNSDSDSSSSDSEESRDKTKRHRQSHRKPRSRRNHPEQKFDDSYLVPIATTPKHTANDTPAVGAGGVPYRYWMEKRRELLLWSELVEPGIAFFGMSFYFAGCLLHALLTCPVTRPQRALAHVAHATSTKTFSKAFVENDIDNDQLCYDHIRHSMVWAAIAVALMIPYCVLEARAVQRKRIQSWKHGGGPLECGTTEVERAKNALRWCLCFGQDGFHMDSTGTGTGTGNDTMETSWRYYLRREALYAPSFVCGTLLLWLACGPSTLAFGYLAVYCMVQWIQETSPIRNETLESFRNNPRAIKDVSATVTTLVATSRIKGGKRRCVRIRYALPPRMSSPGRTRTKYGNKNEGTAMVFVTKDIQSEVLYNQCEVNAYSSSSTITVPIHLHPSYPLSGYPTVQLEQDISDSWSLLKWQFVCFVALWCYLVAACSDLNVDFLDAVDGRSYYHDEGGGIEDLFVAGMVLLSGPALLLPGALVLRQIQHDRFLVDELYEPTTRSSQITTAVVED